MLYVVCCPCSTFFKGREGEAREGGCVCIAARIGVSGGGGFPFYNYSKEAFFWGGLGGGVSVLLCGYF